MTDVPFERKIILTLGAIIIIVPLTAVFGKFASCKYICWQAPFMIIGTKIRDYFHFRGLRLKVETAKCTNCKICTKRCPMNIDVMAQVERGKMNNRECILCGNCIDSCKQDVLKFSVKKL
jgi:formate hydrogenlyase subunit 6/NADH:ubiquinone oxidoreductase subunit I